MRVEFSNVIDAVRCAVNPVARPGDIWRLGDCRIGCGDSTSAADVERVLAI
jgi:hypothetical protein